ncbi:MAG: Helicase associated domain protein, partial [Actinomycetota bacterium]|nr:Helicase associated domain protein [Actinomycetota bacterium]
SRKLISYRLVIATTDKLHRIARKTLEEQDKRASFIGLADLVTAEVDWPTSPEHLRPAKPRKPATPRDYQKEAIRDVVDGFRGADRGQLIMACGTGKTLTSLFIKEKLDAERTLVLLPSLSLLKQTLAVWHANAAQPFDFKAVCSDQTVVAADDEPVAHTAELGIPVTTDPAEIAEFLQRRSGPRVVFSTYQSSPQIEAAFTLGRIPQFDIAIADESHRVAGDESTVFATILNDCAIKAKRRLFMTATPRYYTGRVIKQARADAEMTVASMDDHTKFGEVFHRLSFGDAIRRGLLTDYQVAVIAVNDDETFSELGNRALVNRAGKTTDARTLASQIALAKALRTYNMRRVISFHSRVARAKQYAQEMPKVIDWMPRRQRPDGPLWTGYASGEMSAGERHVRLQRLRQLDDGERGLLTNARCLAEGVDVPTLDGVAFIDPRGSEVDIIQAVGRAIRLAENKTVGTIVIPVFVKTGADAETALRDSSFKAVWRIVKALRAHDEDLAEEIDSIRRSLGQGIGGTRLPAKIHLDVASSISNDFASAFDVMLVEQTSARWEFWLGLLQRYAEETGTARIPIGQVIEGYPLGQWAGAQRMAFSKGALSDERRQKLEALPGWAWNILDDQWDTWMRLMRDFAADHGHTNVPYPYMVGEYNLRNFVATQRGLYRQGKLSQERVEELEALPGWVWDVLEDNWQRNYELLKVYSDREGHACPPRTFAPDGVQVGQWIGVQRGKRVQMSPQRRALLEALPGWSWDPYNDRWRRKYAALVAFARREGHARVPNSHREGDVHLGKWVTHQRSSRDKLTDEQRGLLEALPGWTWDARSEMWQRKYALLQQFQRREGHALVPQGHIEDGVKLGTWVLEQRNHEDTISEERRKLLESVPGWSWNPHEDSFEKGYRALRRFAVREGHSRVPAEHV